MDELKIVKPFAVWRVGEEDYKLKLTTAAICTLEKTMAGNLLNVLSDTVPKLSIMLEIAHAALQKYQHGIKREDVSRMYDRYTDDGGTQIDFMTGVLMPIYQVSGFFTTEQVEQMNREMN